MKVLTYISPSVIPSRSANSIHVIQQTMAFSNLGYAVVLYAARGGNGSSLESAVNETYGYSLHGIELRAPKNAASRFPILSIAIMAVRDILKDPSEQIIISRNLYASLFLAITSQRRQIFEIHMIEPTWPRQMIQKFIIAKKNTRVICISEALSNDLRKKYRTTKPIRVLPDAATAGYISPPVSKRELLLKTFQVDYSSYPLCGFFGHLYPGRGVEILISLAERNLNCIFLVFGGSQQDIERYKKLNLPPNIRFMGFFRHKDAMGLMRLMDVLLMPYQKGSSIYSNTSVDTSRWFSPLKLYEYMAAGRPIISSNLTVLRETLEDGHNCLLVEPHDLEEWHEALRRVLKDSRLATRIASQAKIEQVNFYSWESRATNIIAVVKDGY